MGSPTRDELDEGHRGRVLPMMASSMMGLGTADDGAVDYGGADNVVADADGGAAYGGCRKR